MMTVATRCDTPAFGFQPEAATLFATLLLCLIGWVDNGTFTAQQVGGETIASPSPKSKRISFWCFD